MSTTEQPHTYETGLKRLEEIVALLEKGEIPLEESLTLYKEGKILLAQLNGMLNDAEQQILMLAANEDGTPTAVPFQ